MRAIPALIIACTFASPAAFAVDREFNDIVRAISDEYHTHPMRIPLFGLVKFATFVIRPAGASHIDLAVFEHLNARDNNGRDIRQVVRNAVGRGWSPFVQVQSHRGSGELVMVYMRTEGRNCRLLLTAIERDEATVVELTLNPEGLQHWIASPHESARSSHGGRFDRGDE